MSDIVEYCPTNLTEVIAASARLNCGEDRFGNDQYLCLPNVRKTGLVEYCHKGVIPLIPSGYCVDTTGGQLYSRKCEQFLYGCPSQHFQTNKIYRHPACLNINTENRCYIADPSCPNTTSTFTTEDMMETSSTYSNFSNTTVNTLYTTTTSLEDVPDVGAVVGGVLAAVFVITVLLILVRVVLRRRKQRKNQLRDGRDEETPLFELTNETGNKTAENSNSPAGNGGQTESLQTEPDNTRSNKNGKNKPNALHEACNNAKLEIFKHCIQTYPDLLHNVDNDGWNAALYAARGGNVKILQLLTNNEVDVKHKNNDGWNILHVACVNSNVEMSRSIIQTYPDLLQNVDNDGWNAALHAARGGNVKILELLANNENVKFALRA
ncbi:uncharacterized protein LOC130049233 [Ostrea edulis]|uniref:uncharacterized protein LOC130049208 n=1 Tax=Ostrea edulis TaxID=37623 RepID=UPI0024AF3C7F|nr:uncharacterized protein LOC130049208 [Ostrea edulis]XP_056002575.1 uncharacterized protein LOC130049233 [Ostrea edulis]